MVEMGWIYFLSTSFILTVCNRASCVIIWVHTITKEHI